jgi:hypothetical protein
VAENACTPRSLIAIDRCERQDATKKDLAVPTSSFWLSLILPVSDMLLMCELKLVNEGYEGAAAVQFSSDWLRLPILQVFTALDAAPKKLRCNFLGFLRHP